MKKVTVVGNTTGKNKTAAAAATGKTQALKTALAAATGKTQALKTAPAARQIAGPKVTMLKPAPRAKAQADAEEAEETLRTSRSIPTYLVAECNYNDWRVWGKYIANGWAVPSVNKQNELEIGYSKPADAVVVARHIQNRNLAQQAPGIAAGSLQKYDGYVITQEQDIPAVLANIAAFYKQVDKLKAEIKEMFTVLTKFTLTHPAKHYEISNTAVATTAAAPARKNAQGNTKGNSNTKETLAIAAKGLQDVAKLLSQVEA